jgi:hypothetical protein
MKMNKERKQIQVVSLFLNLHTLAKNAKQYTPLDDNKVPVSEEMRRLDFYAREIDQHSGRDILREIFKKSYTKKESPGSYNPETKGVTGKRG